MSGFEPRLSRRGAAPDNSLEPEAAQPGAAAGVAVDEYIVLGSIIDTVAAVVITLPFVYPLVVAVPGLSLFLPQLPEYMQRRASARAGDGQGRGGNVKVKAETPLICMRSLMLSADVVPVLHQESLYAPDRFEYRMALTRTQAGSVARWTPIA
jgi:hypothetical protein